MKHHSPQWRLHLQGAFALGAGMASFLPGMGQQPAGPWQPRPALARLDALMGNDGDDLLELTPGCVVNGTSASETVIFGGAYCDTAFGLAGDDIMYSYTGTTPDTLKAFGGVGDDYIYTVGRGVAFAYGNEDEDEFEINALLDVKVLGGSEDDVVRAYSYNEDVWVQGEDGDDDLRGYGYRGDILLQGGIGNDRIHGITREGAALAEGGDGNDFIWVGAAEFENTLLGGQGNDTLQGATLTGGWNHLSGGADNDLLIVGLTHTHAADPLYTYGGALLMGELGDDVLLAHNGPDTLDGGGGADLLMAYGGDDLLTAQDNLLAHADGGEGTDQLQLMFSHTLEDTLPRLLALERIDLSPAGTQTLTIPSGHAVQLATAGVNALTGTAATLVLDGTAADQVTLLGGWLSAGTGTLGSATYRKFSHPDGAWVWVKDDLSLTVGSADETAADDIFILGPNPSEGWVRYQVTAEAESSLALQLMDAQGRTVWRHNARLSPGGNQGHLDLSGLPAGLYLACAQWSGHATWKQLLLH